MTDLNPETQAKILMLNGLNYSAEETAEMLGVSESSVYHYRNLFEDEAKEQGWEYVFWKRAIPAVVGSEFRDFMATALSS